MLQGDDHSFEGLRIEHLPSDGSLGSLRTVPKGTAVWTRGNPLASIFFLRRGQVRIFVADEKGREMGIRIVRSGEPFGLTCFGGRQRRIAASSAVASVRSEIIEVPCAEFNAFLHRDERALSALLTTLSERLAFAEERLGILANHSAEDRLCGLLEQLASRSGRASVRNPELRRLQFTHAELADLSGLNRAHVSIMMGRLREKGLVYYGRSMPLLVDTAALARRRDQSHFAGFDVDNHGPGTRVQNSL